MAGTRYPFVGLLPQLFKDLFSQNSGRSQDTQAASILHGYPKPFPKVQNLTFEFCESLSSVLKIS